MNWDFFLFFTVCIIISYVCNIYQNKHIARLQIVEDINNGLPPHDEVLYQTMYLEQD